MSVTQTAANPFPKIVAVEVWNFMSIEHGRVEFDEKNIINLKGYNDSGKSGMLTALRVCLLNSNPSKQASFIQDDKEYFRVVVYFEDGVQLLRDKYINGQSLYELHKDGQCLFTTKSGKTLTRVTEVPQPIAEYLGLVTFDGGALNARSCFEKQLGVQTTGAENYKMFNTVLKSEEIATAGTLLNNDKNKLAADINAVDQEIQAQKTLIGDGDKIIDSMIAWLKMHDAELDALIMETSKVAEAGMLREQANAVQLYPEVDSVDTTQLTVLSNLYGIATELSSVRVAPEVSGVDGAQVAALTWIADAYAQLSEAKVAPEVPAVSDQQTVMLFTLWDVVANLNATGDEIHNCEVFLEQGAKELEQLQKEAAEHGSRLIKCPNCGELFDPELIHAHA